MKHLQRRAKWDWSERIPEPKSARTKILLIAVFGLLANKSPADPEICSPKKKTEKKKKKQAQKRENQTRGLAE